MFNFVVTIRLNAMEDRLYGQSPQFIHLRTRPPIMETESCGRSLLYFHLFGQLIDQRNERICVCFYFLWGFLFGCACGHLATSIWSLCGLRERKLSLR